ncbi:MAG: hypothetical protein ABIF09_11365 [Gemmatimonadota bacterium]
MALPPELFEWVKGVGTWQADLIAVPATIAGEDDCRTVAAMVVAEDVVLEVDIHLAVAAEPEDVARAIEKSVSSAAAKVGAWPARVMVRRAVVADVLKPLLRERGCEVGVASVLEGLDAMARGLSENLAGREVWPPACRPNTWAGQGLPGGLVKGLFRAYAAYHRATPWRWLADARIFLSRLVETRGAPATAAGNLKRVFVADMLERMRLRKGNFHLTKRGRELSDPGVVGRLFGHLFRTYFGDFNLEYGRRGPDLPSLQPAVPLLLWKIGVRIVQDSGDRTLSP